MYLLEQVMKQEGDKLVNRAYLVSGEKVSYISRSFNQWNKRRVNLSGFVLRPGAVMTNETFLTELERKSFQKNQRELISAGCTTVVIFANARYESDIELKIREAKHRMANSSIDYLIGLSFPLQLLRPSTIRLCKRLSIPALKLTIDQEVGVPKLPWTHIAQAMLTYPVTLLADYHCQNKRDKQQLQALWQNVCGNYHLPSTPYPMPGHPWPKTLLQKTGLYLKKENCSFIVIWTTSFLALQGTRVN